MIEWLISKGKELDEAHLKHCAVPFETMYKHVLERATVMVAIHRQSMIDSIFP